MPRGINYYGTQEDVRVGDRIAIRRWFRSDREATVIYIPGISPTNREIGNDQWAHRTDDGGVYAGGYFPEQMKELGKAIRLVRRVNQEEEREIREFTIPKEDQTPESWRDLFAFGCLVSIALLLIGAAIHGVRWLAGF